MHTPAPFKETDIAEVQRIIEEYPLATLAYQSETGVEAQHIPLIFDGESTLIGHVAADNNMVSELHNRDSILVIFSGQNSYVSPNWFPTKQDHHRHVPTWNYQAVHITGKIRFHCDVKACRAVVGKLTKHFETKTNGSSAWRMADAPAEYIESMLSQFVPFEIAIEQIEAKSKLSQNLEKIDFESVQLQMERRGQNELAALMQKLKD